MSYVLIEFRDHLTRFGYRYFMDYLLLNSGEVSVKEEGKNEGLIDRNLNKKLIEDLIATIYSVSGQHYGCRSAKFWKIRNCVKQAVEKEEKSC